MEEATLVRTVRFHASHRYWREDWPEERNRRTFGASAETHGHDWVLEVAVRGPIDETTGFVVDLVALDERLRGLAGELDGRDLNRTIAEVREGGMMPSTEGLARWFWRRLASEIPGEARLVRVRVAESADLSAVYEG